MSNHMTAIFYETPWEKRNLGIQSYALNEECLDNLTRDALAAEISRLKQKFGQFFVFARVPKSHLYLTPKLQQCGFYLVEGTVCPYIQFRRNSVFESFGNDPSLFLPKRFASTELSFITSTPNTRPEIALREIAHESFSDDRFHMDFQCPTEMADSRFEHWTSDLLKNSDIDFDLLTIYGELAGFMARNNNHLILAGFSKKYQRSGLGTYLWLKSCQAVEQLGYTHAETLISMNNLPVLNLYGRLGFKFRDISYSFHKWQI